MKFHLVFAPNGGYFVGTDTEWRCSKLSNGLTEDLKSMAEVDALAIDDKGGYILYGLNKNGQLYDLKSTKFKGTNKIFENWQEQCLQYTYEEKKGIRIDSIALDVLTKGATCTGNRIVVVTSNTARWRCGGDESFELCMQRASLHSYTCRFGCGPVSLGVGWDFVIVLNDGYVAYTLRGYSELQTILKYRKKQSQSGNPLISFIALNQYDDEQFLVIFKDGTAYWSLPPAWEKDLKEMLEIYKAHLISNNSRPNNNSAKKKNGGGAGEGVKDDSSNIEPNSISPSSQIETAAVGIIKPYTETEYVAETVHPSYTETAGVARPRQW